MIELSEFLEKGEVKLENLAESLSLAFKQQMEFEKGFHEVLSDIYQVRPEHVITVALADKIFPKCRRCNGRGYYSANEVHDSMCYGCYPLGMSGSMRGCGQRMPEKIEEYAEVMYRAYQLHGNRERFGHSKPNLDHIASILPAYARERFKLAP
jgi:hypothetical protein